MKLSFAFKGANLNPEKLRQAGGDLGSAPGNIQFRTPGGHTVNTPYADEAVRHQMSRSGGEDAYYTQLADALKEHGRNTDRKVERDRDQAVSDARAGNTLLGGVLGGGAGMVLGGLSGRPGLMGAGGLLGALGGGYLGHQAHVARKSGPTEERINEIPQLYAEPEHVKEMRRRIDRLQEEVMEDAARREFRHDLRYGRYSGYPYGYGGYGPYSSFKLSAEKTAARIPPVAGLNKFILGRNARQFAQRAGGVGGAGLGTAIGTIGGGLMGAYNAAPGEGFSGALSGAAKGGLAGAALGGAGGAALGHRMDPRAAGQARREYQQSMAPATRAPRPRRAAVQQAAPPPVQEEAVVKPRGRRAAPPAVTQPVEQTAPAVVKTRRPRVAAPVGAQPAPGAEQTAPAVVRTRRQRVAAPVKPAGEAAVTPAPVVTSPAPVVTSSGVPVGPPPGARGLNPVRPTDLPAAEPDRRGPPRRARKAPLSPDAADMAQNMGIEVNGSLKTAAYQNALQYALKMAALFSG